jgi:hypothetical protein
MNQAWRPISRKFIVAVKLADRPAYRIAIESGLHPSVLSKIMTGAERVTPNDRRVLAVARVLGLRPEECFAPVEERPA